MKNLFRTFLLILIIENLSYPQSTDPNAILKKVIDSFERVEDYEVNVKIKVDVDFLKVPETEAKIYFKQPDKVHFESETFALLPREGFDFSPSTLLRKDHSAFYMRKDTLGGIITAVIKVIPQSENEDVILSTIWVDQSKNVIRKIETTTKTNGTFVIELKYDHANLDYPLPSTMVFSFNVDKLNLPRGFSGDLSSENKPKKKDDKPTTTGKVYVYYSNYKVNKGIPDKFFKEKKKKQR